MRKSPHFKNKRQTDTIFLLFYSSSFVFVFLFRLRDCVSLSFASQNELKNKTKAELFLVSVGLENTLQSVSALLTNMPELRTEHDHFEFRFTHSFVLLFGFIYIFVDRRILSYIAIKLVNPAGHASVEVILGILSVFSSHANSKMKRNCYFYSNDLFRNGFH